MGIDMLLFDYRKPEEKFFETYDAGCFNIKFFEEELNTSTLERIPQELLENVTVISVFIDSDVNEEVLAKFKNLRVVATRSTGVDHIDLETCKKRRIAVINVENYGATTVAQYTLALMLSLVRRIIPANLYMRDYNRRDNVFLGRNLEALTLGVIGTGAIGGSVCRLAKAFGMKILAYDLFPKEEMIVKCDVEYVDFDCLLENSDIITLHAPFTKENTNMISASQFKKMKKQPYIINTSRGELINLNDLKQALVEKQIAGAALDVLTCESMTFRCEEYCPTLGISQSECINELSIVKEIIEMDNVIITPHIAYETQEAVEYILKCSMNSVRDFFKGAHTNRVV